VTALAAVRASTGAAFSALQVPNFRRYTAGQGISLIGTWMQRVAQSWLVLELTGSGTAVGLVVALQALPVLLLGPYGGLVADRLDKRRLVIVLQVTMGVLALVLGLLTTTGRVDLWHVYVLAGLLGVATSFDNPARQSFLLEMVGPEHVRNAVSLNAVLTNVARAVGPAVAGVLMATVGTGVCFLLNAATFATVVVSLTMLDTAQLHPSPPAVRAPGQLRAGFGHVRRTPELAVPLLMMAIVGCLAFEFQIVLPVVAQETFGGGSQAFGLLTAALGLGSVIGGLLYAGRGRGGAAVMVVSAVLFGLSLAGTAVAPSLPVALVALTVTGAVSVVFQSTGNTTLQLNASPSMRGRVMALWSVAFLGTTPIGGPIAGLVSDAWGGRAGLALGAIACFVAAGVGALTLRRARPALPVGQAAPG